MNFLQLHSQETVTCYGTRRSAKASGCTAEEKQCEAEHSVVDEVKICSINHDKFSPHICSWMKKCCTEIARLLFVLTTYTCTHMHTHTHTNTHTTIHRHFQRFFLKMGKWLVTNHLVLSKTNGSTVNLGTITTRKNHKKSSRVRIQGSRMPCAHNSQKVYLVLLT